MVVTFLIPATHVLEVRAPYLSFMLLKELLLSYWCFALRSLCLLAIGLPCFVCSVSCLFGSSLSVFLSCFGVVLGLVPGLSGRRLVQDFQHRPCLIICFFPLFTCVPSLAIANWLITTDYHIPCKDSSVVFLAVDWSGVSPCWPPIHIISALFLAVDWTRDFATQP